MLLYDVVTQPQCKCRISSADMFICCSNAGGFTGGDFSLSLEELFKRPPSSAAKGRPDFHLLTGLLRHFISSRCSHLYISDHVTSFFLTNVFYFILFNKHHIFSPVGGVETATNKCNVITNITWPSSHSHVHSLQPPPQKIAFVKKKMSLGSHI